MLCRRWWHSEAERILHRLLRTAGLIGWRAHARSCGYEIDVVFDAERVAIEIDGWAWHRDAQRHRRDAERQNVLVNAGWHVLRFTWHTLTQDPKVYFVRFGRRCRDTGESLVGNGSLSGQGSTKDSADAEDDESLHHEVDHRRNTLGDHEGERGHPPVVAPATR